MNMWKAKKIIKIIATGVIVTLLFTTGSAISSSTTMEKEALSNESNSPLNPLDDYTHTVLVEAITASWCPACHAAANNIYNLFTSGLYDFYYVSLVTDRLSPDYAYQRALELNFDAWPHYFFDGGYTSWVGNSGLPNAYISRLNLCGARSVADIDLEMYASWEGDSKIGVTIDVINNEATPYAGHLHAYVTEIDSRWNTYYGSPYHYAMIGYAMNMDITIPPGGTYHREVIWNGETYGFNDIELGNIMVIASVFSSPLYYTDETTAAIAIRPGDANGDGVVDVLDFLLVLAQWGTAGPEGDVNHDGIVDVLDFLMVLANWG
jgi:hypothetical protein